MLEKVNRRERICGRAWKQAQAGRIDRYWKLVCLGMEAHTVRDLPGEVRW